MQSRLFLDHPELTAKTGFADFRCVYTQDFLYHKEYVPMPHPIFDGLRPGMMDLDYVSTVFPHETIETEASPSRYAPDLSPEASGSRVLTEALTASPNGKPDAAA